MLVGSSKKATISGLTLVSARKGSGLVHLCLLSAGDSLVLNRFEIAHGHCREAVPVWRLYKST